MNAPQIFSFEQNEVRTILVNDIPYFVGKDVADVLGYQNGSRDVNRHVDEEDRVTERIVMSGQNRNVIAINESGLYSLIINSKLPSAKKFKRWVTSEVLPQIRKTGSYSNVPQSFAQALRLAADLEEKNQLLESTIAEYEPKVNYLDLILSSDDTVTVSQIAQDYGMTPNKMNKLLNELKVQYKVNKQWILTKKYKGQGFVKSKTFEVPKTDGGVKVVMDTRWTQKGRIMLYELLKTEGYFPQFELEKE